MIGNVHKQLLACRLRDVFASSPLVVVYQALGNVRSEEVTHSMQAELNKQLPGSGVRATCMKIKNTIASATGQDAVARFLQTNNLLLGWQLPQHSRLDQLQANHSTRLSSIVHPSSQQSQTEPSTPSHQQQQQESQPAQHHSHQPRLHLPHNTIKALISLSLSASRRQPVALLACFYNGDQVKIKQLLEWAKLDERSVQAELLDQLDAAPAELATLGGAPEALLEALSDAEPHGVLEALDFMGASEESSGSISNQEQTSS